MADAPGIGVGRVGVWRAGVEVEGLDASGFRLSATAATSFVGVHVAPAVGEFGVSGVAAASMSGVFETLGTFTVSAEASLWVNASEFEFGRAWSDAHAYTVFSGVHEPPPSGTFASVGTATGLFPATAMWPGSFVTVGTAKVKAVGEHREPFAVTAVAGIEVSGVWFGVGSFGLSGEADLVTPWLPDMCPGGIPDVGCSPGTSSVSYDPGVSGVTGGKC